MACKRIGSWSLLLVVSCSTPGLAQQVLSDPAYAGLRCGEYYACIPSQPLSQAEARGSRGYPASVEPPAEIAARDMSTSEETRRKGPSTDLSASQLPRATTF